MCYAKESLLLQFYLSISSCECYKMISRWNIPVLRITSPRFKHLLLLTIVFCGSLVLISIVQTKLEVLSSEELDDEGWYADYESSLDEFTINTEGCTIPALRPFDESIIDYVVPPKMVSCSDGDYSLLHSNKTHIWVSHNNKDLKYYNVTDRLKITCCYKSFYRPNAIEDIYSNFLDERIKYNECIYFYNTIEVNDEFVKVSCNHGNKEIYVQYFLFAIEKNITLYDDALKMPKDKPAYNVLVVGIDSISRMNFHRTMPKTLGFLKEKGAIELMGYNKVADNSYPNLVPVLLGHSEEELKKICHPVKSHTYDDCPFIWHWYKEAGYYTVLAEDSAKLGTFNYLDLSMNGFLKSPTNYYLHPFMKEAEANVGRNKDFTTYTCMGQTFFYKLLLDYIENLTEILKSSKLFGFFWESTMSHDYLNYPMLMDEDYEMFLRKLDSSKYLEDTIIFLISDHGMRFGPIRSTKQGRFEERLPFVFILTPPSFRENYSQAFSNLKDNSHKLTTPFDLHETLNDLIDLDNVRDRPIAIRSNEHYARNRGISWFLPIPNNRTCKSAGIADHWCTCHQDKRISVFSTEATNASLNLLRHLNFMLSIFPQCVTLELDEVMDAAEIDVNATNYRHSGKEYLVVVKTEPGGGVFESTLRLQDGEWSVTGTVSRLNLYGVQSHCVHDGLLKLYCFCK